MKKRLLSGIKPTGDIHIGNYFGAMRQFVEMQDNYENFVFIADYHAMTTVLDAAELKKNTMEIAKAYLAVGLDPQKVHLFRQSEIEGVTELCWIFNCLTSISTLKLAHAYKDAEAKGKPVNMGLFDYPVLMAADILMYKSDVVPVGQDQQQHIEMAREIAKTFNNTFSDTFKLPEGVIVKTVATVKGTDGRKMSKSYNNTIGLFDSEEVLRKKIMSIVTDSRKPDEPKEPEECNVFALHKLFSIDQVKEISNRYKEGKISYKESKDILFENMNNFLKPIREKKAELDKDEKYVLDVLTQGREAAQKVANQTMSEVKKKVGLI